MKLLVLQEERFSCQCCGECCRKWMVELMPGEAEMVQALVWPAGDPLVGVQGIVRRGEKTYLRHTEHGCVFLNQANNRCRIHEQFGVAAKPLGCSVFPFQIRPTFAGEASVSSRFDCPSVRKNVGETHIEQMATLQRFARDSGLPMEGFSEATRCNLDRDQIHAVSEFVSTLIGGLASDEQRALFIVLLCDGLATTAVDQLDRVALASAFAELKRQVETITASPQPRPNWLHRMAFRTLLGLYMRRDEDVLNGRAGRIGRVFALTAIVFGLGSFRGLGVSHRPGKLRKAKLFKQQLQPHDPAAFALFWRMIRNKLDSFQFMGQANNNRNFLSGLRSLALMYPLAKAVAKFSALSRGAAKIELQDVDYAVESIEHSFGRLGILNTPMTSSLEKLLLDRETFLRLLQHV